MRCSNCGRESPEGATFCLNCGSRLAGAAHAADGAAGKTFDGPGGLPGNVRCPGCGAQNDPGMNFCQRCGRSIAEATPVPGGPGAPAPAVQAPLPASPGSGAVDRERQVCPNCGGQTPSGFSFCQQCGRPLPAPAGAPLAHAETPLAAVSGELGGSAPVGHGPPPPRHPTPAPAPAPAPANPGWAQESPADIGSLDTPPAGGGGARALSRPALGARESGAPAWGTLVAVRPDGSDGERHPLSGEWIDIGRAGAHADLTFDDRHLAPRHARFESRGGRPWVVPLERQNGVFVRLTAAAALEHGDHVLLGRELFRFELLEEEERSGTPLVRHGVALFGSPARAAWGRLVQLLATGAVLDVRHLMSDEVVVGREEGDVVFPDDEFLSRRHAAFRRQGSAGTIEDLGSSNGTFVRLRGARELAAGDRLRIGDQMFRFESAVR